jgi:hypothetical protein
MFAKTVNPSPARATASYNPFPFDPKINPPPPKVLPGRPDSGFGKYLGIFTDRIEASKSATISKSSSGSWRAEDALPDSQKKTKRRKRRTIETSQNLTDGVE